MSKRQFLQEIEDPLINLNPTSIQKVYVDFTELYASVDRKAYLIEQTRKQCPQAFKPGSSVGIDIRDISEKDSD